MHIIELIELANNPYFLHEVLPFWIATGIATVAIAIRFK